MRSYLITILLLFTLFSGFSQKRILMLQKKNKHKNVYYKPGDDLSFYRKNDKSRITDEILAIDDSVLLFKGYAVPVNDITALHIDEKTRWWLRYKAAQILLIAGTGYLVIDSFNNHEVSKETLVISGSAIALGLLLKILIPNKIKIKRYTKLRIVRL
jgi:hypothetical protein